MRKCSRRCCTLFVHVLVWLILFSPTPNFAADPSPLNDQIQKLSAALDPAVTAKDQAVQKSLLLLLNKIGTMPCDAAGDSNTACKILQSSNFASGVVGALHGSKITDDQIKGLHAALDPVLALSPPNDDMGLTSAMDAATKLASGPKAVVSPADVTAALNGLVKALQAKITAAKPATTLSQDKLDPAIKSTGDVSTNIGLILKALGASDDLIRVTGAWFGDLSAIRQQLNYGAIGSFESNSRYCSATRAVRARCQGKPQCYEPSDSSGSTSSGDGNTTEIDGAHLCGYEPAPFAEPIRKGLIIRYECLSAQDGTWIAAGLGDDTIPGSPIEQGSNDAQLRNGVVAVVRCQQPVVVPAPKEPKASPSPTPSGSAGNISITISGTVPGTVAGTAAPQAAPPPTTKPTPTPTDSPSPAPTKGPAQ